MRPTRSAQEPGYNSSVTLIISSLPQHADIALLHDLCAPYGQIISAQVDVDPSNSQLDVANGRGGCSGRGRVQMANMSQAQYATQALNGAIIFEGGRPLQVIHCVTTLILNFPGFHRLCTFLTLFRSVLLRMARELLAISKGKWLLAGIKNIKIAIKIFDIRPKIILSRRTFSGRFFWGRQLEVHGTTKTIQSIMPVLRIISRTILNRIWRGTRRISD